MNLFMMLLSIAAVCFGLVFFVLMGVAPVTTALPFAVVALLCALVVYRNNEPT